MKRLSLIQPWATLILSGAKRFETRSWRTPYRGPLAIHAGGRFPSLAKSLCPSAHGSPPHCYSHSSAV